jgi:Ser/Thr protein kinase RdoA (MazF antagonist)
MKEFFSLNPDSILEAVESALQREEPDLRATGRSIALNSMENRVYDVELEDESHVVAKFYRPGRWTGKQILEEHQFLFALDEMEIPVVAPLELEGESLFKTPDGIFYTLFPKVRGRLMDELDQERLKTVGRYIARIHNVGEHFPFQHRLKLSVKEWGINSLEFLINSPFLPSQYTKRYQYLCDQIFTHTLPLLESFPFLSLHGDCHLGNTLWQQDSPFFLDFDDSISAPAVQDIWMVVRGRDTQANLDRNCLLEGYEAFRKFPRESLKLIEPLRALRMIQYSAWIGKRWDDPHFPKAFPHYGTSKYWEEEMLAMQEVVAHIMDPENQI